MRSFKILGLYLERFLRYRPLKLENRAKRVKLCFEPNILNMIVWEIFSTEFSPFLLNLPSDCLFCQNSSKNKQKNKQNQGKIGKFAKIQQISTKFFFSYNHVQNIFARRKKTKFYWMISNRIYLWSYIVHFSQF